MYSIRLIDLFSGIGSNSQRKHIDIGLQFFGESDITIAKIKGNTDTLLDLLCEPAKSKVNGKRSWICPLCSHGTNGDGITLIPDNPQIIKCFGCEFTGDIIKLYCAVKGYDHKGKEFVTAVNELADMLGIPHMDNGKGLSESERRQKRKELIEQNAERKYERDSAKELEGLANCLERVANDSAYEDTVRERASNMMNAVSKGTYKNPTAIRDFLADNAPDESRVADTIASAEYEIPFNFKPDELTENSCGDRFLEWLGEDGNLRYNNAIGWLHWNGKRWVCTDDSDADTSDGTDNQLSYSEKLANDFLSLMLSSSRSEIDSEFFKFAKRMDSVRGRNNILEYVKTYLQLADSELDHNGMILNTPDGIVNLRTGELKPNDPKEFCTHITRYSPANPDSDSDGARKWNEFLDWITCNNADLKDFLQQVCGMAAIGDHEVLEECLIVPFGSGGNGKSTLFNAVSDVLGSYSATVNKNVFVTQNDSQSTNFNVMTLKGARLCLTGELEDGETLSTSALKAVSSHDKITAQKKYKDPIEFYGTHTAIMYTNYLPKVPSTDDGTWRRLIPIPFNAKRNDEDKVVNYTEILKRECGSAILRWIIDGAVKYLHNGKLIKPDIIKDACRQYRVDEDTIEEFLAEKVILTNNDTAKYVTVGTMWTAYQNYYGNGRYAKTIGTRKTFNAELERRGLHLMTLTNKMKVWQFTELKN